MLLPLLLASCFLTIALLTVRIILLTQKLSIAETSLLHEKERHQEKLQLLHDAQARLSETFRTTSDAVLKSSNQASSSWQRPKLEKFQLSTQGDLESRQKAFHELVKPIKESLEKVDHKLLELEKNRTATQASLTEQIRSLTTTQTLLQAETHNLVKALRAPHVRGRWGEIQLQRVVEMAGMIEHCDFVQQETQINERGRLRPDMIIKLPNQKQIVVDSKTPLHGYLEALEAPNEESRQQKLSDHARHIRTHIQQLSAKSYWDQFASTPELVILFIPGETFFSAALESQPDLIEYGVNQRVIIATPTTLIALLRAVAYGWQQEQVAENAEQLRKLGHTLYERVRNMTGHIQDLGRHMEKSLESYNKFVGSFERRVRVTAQKFKELGATTADDIPEIEAITQAPRQVDTQ